MSRGLAPGGRLPRRDDGRVELDVQRKRRRCAELAPRQLSGHGLSYWTDGKDERIIYVTIGYRLVALDAKTGSPIPTFGNNGMVDLKIDDDQDMDLVTAPIGLHSTPRREQRRHRGRRHAGRQRAQKQDRCERFCARL